MKLRTHAMRILATLCLGVLTVPASNVLGQAPWWGGGGSASSETPSTKRIGSAIIQADPETGTLIVITDEETNAQIGRIVANIDMPVPQALIKVLFLEVTHTKGLSLGVDKASYTAGRPGEQGILETLFDTVTRTGEPLPGWGLVRIIEDDFQATLRALGEAGKLEVLSRPSILARNNQEALFSVGQEVPFISNSRITNDGQTINTIEYEDIGIILRVVPHITPDGLVELDVAAEISTLTGDSVVISESDDAVVSAPIFAKRLAETKVIVPDGMTVVIGGLMEDQKTENIRRVPILGSIPFLGALFRWKVTTKSKTELLIFLTPHIVRTTEELSDLSEAEAAKADLAPKTFSAEQLEKYLDSDQTLIRAEE